MRNLNAMRFARLVIGFLVAPSVPALVVYVVSIATSSRGEATWSFWLFIGFGYLAAVFLGVPSYLVLQARRMHGLIPYVLTGALIGLICVVLCFSPYLISGQWLTNHEEAFTLFRTGAAMSVPAILSGAFASAAFWFIAGPKPA